MLHQNFVYYGSKHEIEWTKIKFGTNFSDKKCTIPFFFFFFKIKKNGYLNCILHMRENGSNVYHKKKRKREW